MEIELKVIHHVVLGHFLQHAFLLFLPHLILALVMVIIVRAQPRRGRSLLVLPLSEASCHGFLSLPFRFSHPLLGNLNIPPHIRHNVVVIVALPIITLVVMLVVLVAIVMLAAILLTFVLAAVEMLAIKVLPVVVITVIVLTAILLAVVVLALVMVLLVALVLVVVAVVITLFWNLRCRLQTLVVCSFHCRIQCSVKFGLSLALMATPSSQIDRFSRLN